MASVYTEPFSIETLANNSSPATRRSLLSSRTASTTSSNKASPSPSSSLGAGAVSAAAVSSTAAAAAASRGSSASLTDSEYNTMFMGSEYETFSNAVSRCTLSAQYEQSHQATTATTGNNEYNNLSRRCRLPSGESAGVGDVFVEFEALDDTCKRNRRGGDDGGAQQGGAPASRPMLPLPVSTTATTTTATTTTTTKSMPYNHLQAPCPLPSSSTTTSKATTLPPVLSLAGWFHGNISREEAEHRLKNWGAVNGLFLVREKTPDLEYAISYCENGRFEHRLLRRAMRSNGEKGNHWIINETRLQNCTSIESVVALFMSESDLLKDYPRLGEPCLLKSARRS